MDRIALVTYDGVPDLPADDRLVLPPLRNLNIRAETAVWDDPEVRWEGFDAAVLRSCWDYHRRPAEFLDWLERRERQDLMIWNPPRLIRWNLEKGYLDELGGAGIPVVPTARLERGSRPRWADLLESRGWNEAVIKPAISASAWRTRKMSRESAARDLARLDENLQHADMLIQEFFPEIRTEGEWSLIFLGGEYSHAVLKHPRGGDFRVQEELGGTLASRPPAPDLVDQAWRVIESLPAGPLYARVDGVVREGTLVVMEVELIEPSLFLEFEPSAPERFARAIAGFLRDGRDTGISSREGTS